MKKSCLKFHPGRVFQLNHLKFMFLFVAIFCLAAGARAQTAPVEGNVKDAKGAPMIGVTVSVEGQPMIGTTTDAQGNYRLPAVKGDATLLFSFIGYETQPQAVGNRTRVDAVLQEAAVSLENVVVVGYGVMKKKDLTGSISTVDGTAISNRKATQISTALQGALPGVTVTRTNSAPGQEATIRVRGITTITKDASDPLIIIDGIPGAISDVNPNDIESLTVLKDAASASIYGARAAAGVVLITTKRGTRDGATVDYSYSLALDMPTRMPDFADAVGYMRAENELAYNDNPSLGLYSINTREKIENYWQLNAQNPDLYPNTDWLDMILKSKAVRQSHNVSVSAGTEKMRTKVSVGYDDVDGLFKQNLSWERFTLRANNDIRIKKWLNLSTDLYMKKTHKVDPYYSPSTQMRYAAPIYAAEWSDGRLASGKDGDNCYGKMMAGGTQTNDNYQAGGKIQLDITPIKDLTVSAVFSPKYTFTKDKDFNKAVSYRPWDDPNGPENFMSSAKTTDLKESRADYFQHTTQLFANYARTFGLNHNFSAMVGFEDFRYKYESMYGSKGQYKNEFPYLGAGPTTQVDAGSEVHENGYQSIFGRVMYNYKSKYYIQANMRADATSRMARNYRWGYFPSVSAGWVISEENFMKGAGISNVISHLKLRLSYGQLGNERIGYYPYQAILGYNAAVGYIGTTVTGLQAASASQYVIPDITWETTETYDVGIDIGMFKNRLRIGFDWYRKNTKDMLLKLTIPSFIGYTDPDQNAGTMHTNGWDLDLAWSDHVGDFSYSVSFNLSDYKSVMGNLSGSMFDASGGLTTREGYEYQSYYGYVSSGIYQSAEEAAGTPRTATTVTAGDIRYVDISGPEGVPDGKISPEYDRVILGGSLPRYNFGGSINLGWKGIDLGIVFQGVAKRTAIMPNQMVEPLRAQWYNVPKFVEDNHWSPMNTFEANARANYPRYSKTSSSNNYATSDYWLFDGSYFRIKNITVGYTLPRTWLQKVWVKDLRFSVSLSDFFTFSHFPKGWDPEVSSTGYPITKSVVFSAAIKF